MSDQFKYECRLAKVYLNESRARMKKKLNRSFCVFLINAASKARNRALKELAIKQEVQLDLF